MTSSAYPIYNREWQKSYNRFWEHNAIKNQMFHQELAMKPSFKFCFGATGINLTQAFLDDIKNRTKGEIPLSLVIQIIGIQGSGKSKLSFQFAKRISGKRFTSKHIFLEREKLLNAMKTAKPNDTYILDEQTLVFGEGSLRQLAELQNIQEVTRINQIHFIYNSPTPRTHLAAHYSIKVLQQNKEFRITKYAFCSNDYNKYFGFGLAKIPEDKDDKIYMDYEPKKLAYVTQILERNTKKYDIWGLAEKLNKHPKKKFIKTKQDLIVLAEELFPTMTTGELKKVVSAMFMQNTQKLAQMQAQERGKYVDKGILD